MAFPLTKYVVVGVFSVVFISAIEALSPKDKFYEVYTQRQDEVEHVIEKAMHPVFQKANNALCRCLIQRTGAIVSRTDESIHALISETETYTFIYEKPLYNIRVNLLTCPKNQEIPNLNVAFSVSEDEYFYVVVSKTGSETCEVRCMIRVPGFKDNDQKKLSKSPYWCRVAAQIRHELRTYTTKSSDIVPMITKEVSYYSPFQDTNGSHKKILFEGTSNNNGQEQLSHNPDWFHTAAEAHHATVAHTKNENDIVTKIPIKKRPSYKLPHDSDEEASNEGPSNKPLSLNPNKNQIEIDSCKSSDAREGPSNDNDREKSFKSTYCCRTVPEASHASVALTKQESDIVAKITMKKRPLCKEALTSELETNNGSNRETADEGPSNDNNWEKLSQSTYLHRADLKASYTSVAHNKKKNDIGEKITKKKRSLYGPSLMPVQKKNNDSDKQTSNEGSLNQPNLMEPTKGSTETENDESSDTDEEPLNETFLIKPSEVMIEIEGDKSSDAQHLKGY